MTYGELIKSRRRAMNIAQDKLAAMTGISQSCISRIEREVVQPKASDVFEIAKVLKIKMSELKFLNKGEKHE